ncbi:prevent-host-death protein [Petrimonas sp.]|uniref:prevent-host-death protein n=1 Tax=Petrimonas sp. TaxID=2023866 RepID=UPI003F50FBF8
MATIISSREFRDRQGYYFGLIEKGERIILRRKGVSYKLTPLKDDSLMTEEEFYAKIDRSLQQAKEGKTTTLRKEDIAAFLETL